MSSSELDQPNNDPKGVIHYRLLIETTQQNDLIFVRKMVRSSADASLVEAWAKEAARDHFAAQLTRDGSSPYDLPANKSCWIILELDGDKKGWQFDEKKKAIAVKDPGNTKIKKLKHVYHNSGLFDEPQGDGCYVVYFHVEDRLKNEKCEIDIITEFLQDGKRLKIIIDPDVPNTGDDPP